MRHRSQDQFDAIVVGGSYAGLSAATQLARARRRVLVIDAGLRRNRFAAHSHGFLTQDGADPAHIAAVGRAQLEAYPGVRWIEETAVEASVENGGFQVALAGNAVFHGRRLVLATGVVDELPAIEGLRERWGSSVFHCPYCHGYELNNGRIGVLAAGPLSLHHAMMLPDWGQVTLFTNQAFIPDHEQARLLAERGVAIETARVRCLADTASVVLEDGRALHMDGLFTLTRTRMASPLAEQLGCTFMDGPLGPFVQTDALQKTSVDAVFACGDAARMAGSVAMAVGDGAMAGVAAHQSLVFAA